MPDKERIQTWITGASNQGLGNKIMAQETSFQKLLNSAMAEAERLGGSAKVAKLAGKLLEDAVPEDAVLLSAVEIGQLTVSAERFLSSRKLGRANIQVSNPEAETGRLTTVTIVEIANDDMPFLVDSTLALLAEKGFEISLVLHPVLEIRRDSKGGLQDIGFGGDRPDRALRESYMHIHITRLGSREERDALADELKTVLRDVRTAVLDWQPMQARVKDVISSYQTNPPPVPVEELTETMAFLQWLLDNHFTFLGIREFEFDGGAETGEFKVVEGSGLGILRNPDTHVMRRGGAMVTMTPEIRSFLLQPAPLFITKSDVVANVHRRAVMDYVGIKLFDEDGNLSGELRAVGLFTSTAYTRSPREIPMIRRKIGGVVTASGFGASSHSGKGLLNVLETFPRDELFQIDTETLAEIAAGVMRLEERPRTRLFVRRDKFDRFVSVFVYISRDRFNTALRRKIGERLAEAFGGRVTGFSPSFGDGVLVRVHFNIARDRDNAAEPDLEALEAEIVETVRTWDDRLSEAIDEAYGPDEARRLKRKYRDAFSPGYQEAFTPQTSLYDIREIEALSVGESITVEFYRALSDPDRMARLKVYHYDTPIPLTDRLPILQNMGLRAIEETTFTLTRHGTSATRRIFIHEVHVETEFEADIKERSVKLEDCFTAVWYGLAENDAYNALVLREGMVWRDAALLRAFGKYLRQTGIAFSGAYMAATLVKHSGIARQLAEMFHIRFTPGSKTTEARSRDCQKIAESIDETLQAVPSLDEDRIIRRFMNLISSILRTNFFQMKDGELPPTMAFKIKSGDIDELPEPRPFAEIFVYAPDIEGVHLRGGKIARGGLRWSDRQEDFRTEVLGLAKAQNVKNAVIVPVGAKGGFVPKRLPVDGSREEVFAEGTRAYKLFVSSLLDITDNIAGDKIVPPEDVVRYDEDDPYLVVAADKGTATFSDTANGLSAGHGFWLDDAFASGGSAGYDHKAMGITARGAWEAVKRHFREMDTDIQTTPFTVIGVGDMSGDVFGNGMLLSEQIKLLAAFDHRDIFFDPDPDPAASFAERKRLFETPRTTWQDYDAKLISKGGGVFSRQLKSIPLSAQMRALTGLSGKTATPHELLTAILKMQADLLWFGGIGTYVRASSETDADSGDRANDAIRITARELQVKVIGEGANLGVTQLARMEFAAHGGRINTDAVDNSAGVSSSDMEVNIKIALSAAEAAGKLTRPQRNKLLADMTDDVARLCLRNNYLQTLCLTMSERLGRKELEYLGRMMHFLESEGLLDRKVEQLPDDVELAEREAANRGLLRPELSVLMAYAKIVLYDTILASDVPDDAYFKTQLFGYFPQRLAKKFAGEIENHKLRREIVATIIANSIINRGGPSFTYRLVKETGHDITTVTYAFAAARDAFGFPALNDLVDELDNKIPGETQISLYMELQRILRRATIWFLRNENARANLEHIASHYRKGLSTLSDDFGNILPEENMRHIDGRVEKYVADGVPQDAARRLANLRYLQRGPDIVYIATELKQPIKKIGSAYFHAGNAIGLGDLMTRASRIESQTFYERMAINRTIDTLFTNHRSLVSQIVSVNSGKGGSWEQWSQVNGEAVARARQGIDELLADREFGLAPLAVAASYLSDLTVGGTS